MQHVSGVASRVRLVTAAWGFAAAVASCQGPDPSYSPGAGDADATGVGGQAGLAGTAGATTFAGGGGASPTDAADLADLGDGGGAAGTLAIGTPCTTCMVNVSYTCRSDATDTGQASFVLDVTNDGATVIPLARLTLRYWYTIDANKEQELDCDFAKLGCTNLVTSADVPPAPAPSFVPVMPPRMDANEYAEIAFTPGALALDALLDTGEIQLRLHNEDFSPIDQLDDYSFDCAMKGSTIDAPKITAYVDDVLVWGTEPQ